MTVTADCQDLWAQVGDQGTAYQTEAEAWSDDRKQHNGREACKDNQ